MHFFVEHLHREVGYIFFKAAMIEWIGSKPHPIRNAFKLFTGTISTPFSIKMDIYNIYLVYCVVHVVSVMKECKLQFSFSQSFGKTS